MTRAFSQLHNLLHLLLQVRPTRKSKHSFFILSKKGNSRQNEPKLENAGHVHAFFRCSINIYTKYVLVFKLISTGHSHAGSLFTNILGIFAPHAPFASLVYDVTNTDCWPQNGSIQLCFLDLQMSFLLLLFFPNQNKTWNEILLCVYFFISFLSTGLVMLELAAL